MTIKLSDAPEPTIIALAGDVGAREVGGAAAALRHATPTRRHAVIDMHQVRSIDAGSVDSLVDAAEALGEQGIEVRVVPSWALSVLQLTGRWKALEPHHTRP